jgi:aryl-phospho-beta-D-glucosidase BglC (GH1 family)
MNQLKICRLFFLILFFTISTVSSAQFQDDEGKITDISAFCSAQKGFNLLGKFDVSWSNSGFTEKEFRIINELGFNFVRLPLDFRTYTQYGNWDKFLETELVKIDKAVEWGIQYNVHVCINLHRAPGYCVNSTTLPVSQQLNLWTDSVAQTAFVNHWKMFANRYKDVPPDKLSFNLVNEPSNVSEEVYVRIMKKAMDTIHDVTPDRIIFVDGMNYARDIILSLKGEPNVAQSLHSYDPFQLTHYKAGWVNGSSNWPVPHWPMLWVSNYLYGPWKSEFKSPLVFQGNFPEGTEITVNVRQVSVESTLRIKAGNKVIYSKKFVCSAEKGDDFTQIVETQWGYQNISNKDFSVTLTEPGENLSFENASGDWMTINSITIKLGEDSKTYYLSDGSWGKMQETYTIDEAGNLKTTDGDDLLPFEDYRRNFTLAREHQIPVMIQEFGVHNQTPHDVTIAFLTDLSRFFREYEMGWALWNLTGSFGIFNSSRTDCSYETYQGYKLDRAMLDALTKSGITFSELRFQKNSLKIYPSPANNELFFISEEFNGNIQVQIRNISGRLVKNINLEQFGNGIARIDIAELKSGIYLISAEIAGRLFTSKFVVKK